jgi:hypothetical protein
MTTRRRRCRPGLALVLVTVHAVLIMSAWAVANRQTVGLIRLKEHAAARPEPEGYREPAARRLALGYALALLETGDPPSMDYACGAEIDADADGDADFTYVLTFHLVQPNPAPPEYVPDLTAPGANRWLITIEPYNPGNHPPKDQMPWPWHL